MIRALSFQLPCALLLWQTTVRKIERVKKNNDNTNMLYIGIFFTSHTHPKNIKTYFIRNCFEGAHCRAWRFGSATFLGCQLKYLNSMRNSLPSFFSHFQSAWCHGWLLWTSPALLAIRGSRSGWYNHVWKLSRKDPSMIFPNFQAQDQRSIPIQFGDTKAFEIFWGWNLLLRIYV